MTQPADSQISASNCLLRMPGSGSRAHLSANGKSQRALASEMESRWSQEGLALRSGGFTMVRALSKGPPPYLMPILFIKPI